MCLSILGSGGRCYLKVHPRISIQSLIKYGNNAFASYYIHRLSQLSARLRPDDRNGFSLWLSSFVLCFSSAPEDNLMNLT